MGFFGNMAFWKKKDEFSDIGIDKPAAFGSDLNSGLPSADAGFSSGNLEGGYGMPTQPQAQPAPPVQAPIQQPSFQPQFEPPSPPAPNVAVEKDFEVISSKLDALRATLDSINQRLTNIEAIAKGEEEHHTRKKYYRY